MQSQHVLSNAANVAESIKSLEELVKSSIVPSTTGAVAPVRQLRASSAPRREETKYTNRQVASEILIANSKLAATKPLRPDRALSERPRPSHPGEVASNEPRLTQERLQQYAAAHARLTAPPRPGPRSTAGSTLLRKITNLAALLPIATQPPPPPGASPPPGIPPAAAAILNGIPPVRKISSSPAGLATSALANARLALNSPGVPLPGMGPPTGARPTSAAPRPLSPRQVLGRSGSFQQPPQPPPPSQAPQHHPPAAQQQRRQGAWGPTQPSPPSAAGAASPGMPPPDRAFGPRAANYPSRVPGTPAAGATRLGAGGGPSPDFAAASPSPRWAPNPHTQNQAHQGNTSLPQQHPSSLKQRSDELPPRPSSVRGQRGPPHHHVGPDGWPAAQVRLDSPGPLSPRGEGGSGGGADAAGGVGPKSRSPSPHLLLQQPAAAAAGGEDGPGPGLQHNLRPRSSAPRHLSPQAPPPQQQTLAQQRQQDYESTQPQYNQAGYHQGDDNRAGGGGGGGARPWTARRRPQSCGAGPTGLGPANGAAAAGMNGAALAGDGGGGDHGGGMAWPPVVVGLRDVPPSQLPGGVGGAPGGGRSSDDGTHASWWQNGTADSEASYPMTAVTDRHAAEDRMTPSEAALWLGRMAELEAEVLEEREFRRKYEDELKRLAGATRSKMGQGSGGGPAVWQTSGGRVLTGARAAAAAVARHRWGVTS